MVATNDSTSPPDSRVQEPLLEAAAVKVQYGRLTAVHSASLRVDPGEIVSLLGPNGAGKTSTLGAMTGLIKPASGTVRCRGHEATLWSARQFLQAGVVHVPEGRHLFPEMSVIENLQLGALIRRADAEARLERVCELFPLLGQRKGQLAGTLSGGEQQMLAIGRGLMSNPELLILDEPSLGLAPVIVQTILDALGRLRAQGLSILVVEQDVHVAVSVADRCYLMELGTVVMEGTSAAFMSDDRVRDSYLGLVEG